MAQYRVKSCYTYSSALFPWMCQDCSETLGRNSEYIDPQDLLISSTSIHPKIICAHN